MPKNMAQKVVAAEKCGVKEGHSKFIFLTAFMVLQKFC